MWYVAYADGRMDFGAYASRDAALARLGDSPGEVRRRMPESTEERRARFARQAEVLSSYIGDVAGVRALRRAAAR